EIWAVAEIATGNAYAIKKGVDVDGMRQVSGEVLLRFPEFHGESGASIIRERENYLLVPMTNEAGQLRAVQAISEDGAVKSFMRGAQKKGTMLVIGAESFDELIASSPSAVAYSEGVATGASFRMASGLPVVVCFDAGNLETVVAQTAPKLPTDLLAVLAADNDQFHVERALGFLSDKLGLNPHLLDGQVVNVLNGENKTRQITLGEAIADGEWHQTAKGAYRMAMSNEEIGDAIRSVMVEIVPVGGRTIRTTFENRGLEAGRVALDALEKANVNAVMLVPTFTSLVGRPTDWNDLHKKAGLSAVSAALQLVDELELPGIATEIEMHGLERQRSRAMAIER
ncbi:MAG: hypothetical protein U1E13_07455, partial [Methylophilaceae bacterium]|nr:hypothetical protein [Methylophilaceae bacterium]